MCESEILIWTHEEATEKGAKQLSTSGCGATALVSVLRALQLDEPPTEKLLEAVVLRKRAYAAPLAEYLASRSVAGCSGEELIESMIRINAEVTGKFYNFEEIISTFPPSLSFPISNIQTAQNPLCVKIAQMNCDAIGTLSQNDSDSELTDRLIFEFIAQHLQQKKALIATLNLQLLGNDAWHHQFIYGVDLLSRSVWCVNPVRSYPINVFRQLISTSSHLLVRRSDVVHRPVADTSLFSEPLWKSLDVEHQLLRIRNDLSISFVKIPAIYKGGIAIFENKIN